MFPGQRVEKSQANTDGRDGGAGRPDRRGPGLTLLVVGMTMAVGRWLEVDAVCGVAGWVCWSGSSLNAGVTESMVRAGGVCPVASVRTVRSELLTLAVCGCTQLRQASTAAGDVVVAVSGTVTNRRELRTDLETLGRRPDSGSDADLVLAGLLQWDIDGLVPRLAGAYGLVIWEGRRGPGDRLVLVRDRLGVQPLFWSDTDDGVVFGSTEASMLAHPEVEPIVTLDGLRFLFGHDRTPGTGLWDQMTEVAPGAMLVADMDRRETGQYWQLTPGPHGDDASLVAERVAELLGDSATGALPASPDDVVGVLLGGLDSSVLAALAKDAKTGPDADVLSGGRVLGLTLDDRSPEGDAAYTAQVAAALGMDFRAVRPDADQLADPQVRERVLRARALPMGVGDLDFSLLHLLDTAAEHGPVWLSGEGADAVFASGRMYDQHSLGSPTFPWLVGMERITVERDLFTPGFGAALNLDEYVAEQYRSAAAEIQPVPGEPATDAARRRVQYLVVTRFLRQLWDRADRISRAAGVRVRMPYADHRLIEYLYNTAWPVKRPPGGPGKQVLRDAFGDRVPAVMLNRRKVPYPLTASPAYTRLVQRQATEIVRQPSQDVWDMFDRDRVRTIADTPAEDVEPRDLRALERVADMALWFSRYTPIIE